MWYDMSKLTEEEQKELDLIYERYGEIEAAIYGYSRHCIACWNQLLYVSNDVICYSIQYYQFFQGEYQTQ